jgi:hypothetical protein
MVSLAQRLSASPFRPRPKPAAPLAVVARRRLDPVDLALICVFILGIYTHYTIQITARVPFPSVPAGLAGMVLLWRRRDDITPAALGAFLAVVLLYAVSILFATDLNFLGRRFNGLVQLTYSLTIGYALFLTVRRASRRQIAAVCLSFALVLAIGCVLETYAGFRPVSDAVRLRLYSSGIYENDFRDLLFYGRVRPKFFASEPATVTFTYALVSFLWLVVSRWRQKMLGYLGLAALGMVAMPGPTLMLMLVLVVPYELFASTRNGIDLIRLAKVACMAGIVLAGFSTLSNLLFHERMRDIASGNDASYFYRVHGPPLGAMAVMKTYPIAGGGLTGEPFVQDLVVNAYMQSPKFSPNWQIVSPATELLINYFWLHWVYFGVVWGVLLLLAVSAWLKVLAVPSALFCWLVWAVLGQASGAYVGPTCWAVMFLTAAAAVLHEREPVPARPRSRWYASELAAMRALRRALARRLPRQPRPDPSDDQRPASA